MSIPAEFYGLTPESDTMIGSWIDFKGQLLPVGHSVSTLVEDGGDSGLEGNLLYVIDINKHLSCYAILADAETCSPGTRIGWAVFDEIGLVGNPIFAAFISENNADNDRKILSANVLILQ
jgi:hypothetical protein